MMQSTPMDNKASVSETAVWVFIFFDMCIFALYFWIFSWGKSQHPEMYQLGQSTLNQLYGGINTLVLLVSSYFMATAVKAVREKQFDQYKLSVKLTMLGGLIFLLIKIVEYHEKINAGFSIISNEFYRNYFSFTGFHLMHVFFGLGFLSYLLFGIKNIEQAQIKIKQVESIGIYWHMVDLLWIILFSLVYLAP